MDIDGCANWTEAAATSSSCPQQISPPQINDSFDCFSYGEIRTDIEEIKCKLASMRISNDNMVDQNFITDDQEMSQEFDLRGQGSSEIEQRKYKLYCIYQKQYKEYISKLNGLSENLKIKQCDQFNQY